MRSTRRRRGTRLLRRLVGTLVAVALLGVAALGGIGWYFSGLAVALDPGPSYPQMVQRVLDGRVQLSRDRWSDVPGRYGLAWDGGYGTVGPPTSTTEGSVVRPYTAVDGTPTVGEAVWVDPFAYDGDPRTAHGLAFQDVTVPGDLGDLPAWYVPAAASSDDDGAATGTTGATRDGGTWVVFVHGRGASREESLRYLPLWHRLGLPVLVPTYRNDAGAPASPDGRSHLGDTEWQDVAASVRWALDRGADDVVLAGWSMGGAISLQVVDRAGLGPAVRGVVLDSPVLDWRDVFTAQGAERGLPAPVTAVAVRVLEQRYDLDLDRFDRPARADELDIPVLLVHSAADTYVPDGPSRALAAARPDLVTYVDVPQAEHTRGWNVDPARYEAAMTTWLSALGAVPQ